MMIAFQPLEFIVTIDTTYVIVADQDHVRRIYTDGRDWPMNHQPTYAGYSIGRWIDEDGDGRYDVLEVETRGPFKGPRVYDFTGLPLHFDNQSVFKERIYLDKANPNILHDEMTVIDNALTRPWVVDKKYVRNPNPRPEWPEISCPENNAQIFIGTENYFPSADGHLMSAKKDQPPPDLRYFNQSRKMTIRRSIFQGDNLGGLRSWRQRDWQDFQRQSLGAKVYDRTWQHRKKASRGDQSRSDRHRIGNDLGCGHRHACGTEAFDDQCPPFASRRHAVA